MAFIASGENAGSGTSISVARPGGTSAGQLALVTLGIKGGMNVNFTAGTGIPSGWSQSNLPVANNGTNIDHQQPAVDL
jgi:hypothetical protein